MMQNVLHAILHHTKNKDNLDFGFRNSDFGEAYIYHYSPIICQKPPFHVSIAKICADVPEGESPNSDLRH